MIPNDKPPTYVKIGSQFLIVFFIRFFINVAQNILIPFAFAVLIAILLLPVANFFESKNVGKVTFIEITILLAVAFVTGIIYALILILGVMIGRALIGISGLFLSVPALALVKIVCDHIESLKPWGLLMGDDTTYSKKICFIKGFNV